MFLTNTVWSYTVPEVTVVVKIAAAALVVCYSIIEMHIPTPLSRKKNSWSLCVFKRQRFFKTVFCWIQSKEAWSISSLPHSHLYQSCGYSDSRILIFSKDFTALFAVNKFFMGIDERGVKIAQCYWKCDYLCNEVKRSSCHPVIWC